MKLSNLGYDLLGLNTLTCVVSSNAAQGGQESLYADGCGGFCVSGCSDCCYGTCMAGCTMGRLAGDIPIKPKR